MYGICIALGILMLLYGVFIAMARAGTMFFAVWLLLGAAAVAFGAAGMRGALLLIPRELRIAISALVMALAALTIFTFSLVMSEFSAKGQRDADAIIVLGAQIFEERPSIVLRNRLDTAVEYLKANTNTICIVSGGQGANEPASEASVMRTYLLAAGIEDRRVIMEERSCNTSQNIDFSKELLPDGCESVGIVTSNFHVYRGLAIAKRKGLPSPFGVASPSAAAYLPNNIFRECMGIVKDFAYGNI